MTAAPTYYGALVTLGSDRFWTGDEPLRFSGQTYLPSYGYLQVGALQEGLSQPDGRMTLTVPIDDSLDINPLLADPGPVEVTIEWIVSNNGRSWNTNGLAFYGRLSDTSFRDGTIQYVIETPLGDVDHGKPGYWSHEDQLARDPSDLGLEYVAQLEKGIPGRRWPNVKV